MTLGPSLRGTKTSQFLGLFAIGGAALTVAGYEMVLGHVGLANVDLPLAIWCEQNVREGLVAFTLRAVTQLGSTVLIVSAACVVAIAEKVRGRANGSVRYLLLVVGGGVVLTNAIKFVVKRDRPEFRQFVATSSSSFPSGHTVAAAASWAGFAYLLSRNRGRSAKIWLVSIAGLVGCGVAVSRVALGVHWFTDVVAGLSAGWGWAALITWLMGDQLGVTIRNEFGRH
jgi:membrane-associated phospholipid phosphatase